MRARAACRGRRKPARQTRYARPADASVRGLSSTTKAGGFTAAAASADRAMHAGRVPRMPRWLRQPRHGSRAWYCPFTLASGSDPRHESRVALLVDQTTEAIPANPAVGAVPGPVDDERLALDVGERDRPPEARVVALVAVVAHHEDGAGRHAVRAVVLPAAGHPARRRKGGVRVVPWLPVDVDLLAPHLDRLPADGDDTLDEVLRAVLRPDEDDHVAGARLVQPGQLSERDLRQRDLDPRAVDELVHQDVVANLQRRQHRPRRDLESLHDEHADEEREQESDAERLRVLTRRRLGPRDGSRHGLGGGAPGLEVSHSAP